MAAAKYQLNPKSTVVTFLKLGKMNRSTFLKSLFLLAASPKVLAEIKTVPKVPASALFNDLNFVTPHYYADLVAKYGDVSFFDVMTEMGKHPITETRTFYHYQKERTFASTHPITEPVTITITKENYPCTT